MEGTDLATVMRDVGIAPTRMMARNLIKQGAVWVDKKQVKDCFAKVTGPCEVAVGRSIAMSLGIDLDVLAGNKPNVNRITYE